ncbi:MAG: ankyrin repeat domain-containing protein [Treponema sp.]|nr:ankyrin repeat domain-containing protein [Treponema sp.]
MKKISMLLIIVLFISCKIEKVKKPSSTEVYTYYTACAINDLDSVNQFLNAFPEYVNTELYDYIPPESNIPIYQRFAKFLITEKLATFTEEEKEEEEKFIKEYKRYPINIAARYGYLDIVKVLIEKKADINLKEVDTGNTPLINAAQKGHLDVVKELLLHNPDINSKNYDDVSALTTAILNGYVDIIQVLLENGANYELTTQGYTPLMLASAYEKIEAIELLIKNGANVNATTSDGRTTLILATVDGHTESVKTLLANGAEVDGKDKNGVTALMDAAYLDNYDIVNALINAGADVNAQVGITGNYVLDFAVGGYEANKKSFKVIDLLVSKGAKSPNVNITQYKQQYTKQNTQQKPKQQEQKTEKQTQEKATKPTIKKPYIVQNIVETLLFDLRKTTDQILREHPDAVIVNANTIICGTGGYLGGGQFYGYSWDIQNGRVKQANYISVYDDDVYKTESEAALAKFGQGFNLNGNGYVWNTYINSGGGLMMVNGKPKTIVFAAQTDFIDMSMYYGIL